jgi:replication factor A1
VIDLNNLEELIQKIAQKTNLSRGEIKKKIEEKKEELGFFVNDIAAAHIIAKDLGVPLGRSGLQAKPKLNIKSLKKMEPGLSGVSLTAVVLRIYHPIEFVKEGSKSYLAPVLLHDGTESIRTVLWGRMARLIAEKQVERGSIIKIKQAYTKMGRNETLELHLGDRGSLEIDTEAETEKFPDPEDEILNLDVLDEEMWDIDVRATVTKVGNLVSFNRSDGTEGRVTNLFVKGSRAFSRIVFWDNRAEEAFNYTRGDELLIQGANVKLDREGKAELHATRTTQVTKIGHKSLPSLTDTPEAETVTKEIIEKKLVDIKADDGMISVIVRKGPVSDQSDFTRRDGTPGSVKRAVVFDETSECTLVLWNESISLFDELEDGPFQINKVRVNLSRYKTIELHTVFDTEFNPLTTSQISEDPPIQDIHEIKPQQGLASIQGVLQNVSEVNEFSRSDGSSGRVASMELQDATGSIRVVAWGDNVEKLEEIKEKEIQFVKVFFGGVRQKDADTIEIHLTQQSHLRQSTRIPAVLRGIEVMKTEPTSESARDVPEYQKMQLSDLSEEEDNILIEVLGKVVRLFQQVPYYYACPSCRKKVTDTDSGWYCQEHQEVEPEARFRLSGILDDGTGTIRTTFFGLSGEILTGMSANDIQKLIENNLTDDEIFTAVQQEAEGKTVLIQGRVKLQTREVQDETMQDQILFANRVRFPSPKTLAEELISEMGSN